MRGAAHRPAGVKIAGAIYSAALSTMSRPLAAVHGDMRRSFVEACADAQQARGFRGLCYMTLAELWDLARTRVGGGRRARVTQGAAGGPRRSSSARGLTADARHALRALSARRAESAVAVTLLALGLATTGSIFAVADALLFNPAPFPQSDRLLQIWSRSNQNLINSVPRDLAVRWLDRADLFSSGGTVTTGTALVTSNGDPESMSAGLISPGLLETLGVRPVLGRTFAAGEGGPGSDHEVILGADVWAERFGSSPDVIGRTITINAAAYTIVGVMDAAFRFPNARQRLWLPFDYRNPVPARANGQVTVIARLRPGLSRAQATEMIEAAGPAMAKLANRPWKFTATTHYMDAVSMDPQTRRSIMLLFGATLLLMLVVCANVANLGLSQAFSRARDATIRAALGASRWRLIRQSLLEQLAVGAIALAAAVPLTAAALRVASRLVPSQYTFTSLNRIDLDGRLIAMLAALAVAAPLLAGLLPALAGSRPFLSSALKSETRSVTGSRGSRRFRQSLVVIEVACSAVLLVSAALLSRSFIRLQNTDTGFANKGLISVNLGFPSTSFRDGVSQDLYADAALERIRRIPGVTAATVASGVPPDSGGFRFGAVEIDTPGNAKTELVSAVYEVRPDYFETIGLPLAEGRPFAADEPVEHVIVSQALAAKFWPGASAVGRRFRWEDEPWHEVVGVARTVRDGSTNGSEAFPQTYWPLERHRADEPAPPSRDTAVSGWIRLAVRAGDSAAAMPAIRAALRQVNAGILVQSLDRVDDLLSKDLDRQRFLLALMLVFAGAGLLLAAAGVYSVLSSLVAEQMREYGIRLMLGAPPRAIVRAIVSGGLATAAIGLGIGVAAAAAMGRTIATMLFDVQPRDPLSYIVVGAVLALAAVAAAWRPAHRAAHVDPVTLLRND